jgi:hypothetical protein
MACREAREARTPLRPDDYSPVGHAVADEDKRSDGAEPKPVEAAQWVDSKGQSRKLVSLDLSKDAMGNSCFPGLRVMVPEGLALGRGCAPRGRQ